MSNDPYAEKPWLKSYDDHVPPTLEYPEKSYLDFFYESIQQVPDNIAVHYMGNGITFRELNRYTNQFANFLKNSGVKPGETVGVHLPNIPAYYIAIIGILKAGCVLSGVSPLLQPKELEYQLQDSEAKCLVTLDVLFDKVEKVAAQTEVHTVVVAGIADFLPGIKRIMGKLLKKIPTAAVTPLAGKTVIDCRHIFKNMPAETIEQTRGLDDPMLMQYTGGTTGLPKGAVLTHRNISNHLTQLKAWIDLPVGGKTMLSAFPLFHLAGLFLGMVSLALGYTQVAVPNPRDLDFLISALKKYKPNGVVNVPTIYLELLKKPAFTSLDFSGVEWFISGAAPFPADYITQFEKIAGPGKLLEVYGMTETSPVTTGNPLYNVKKPGSVGIPFPDTEVKLIDPDSGEIVPVGEPGEFVAKGPQVFTIGYHNKAEETANTLRDGWIYTGDICTMDEDGYFYVVDRVKDMVIVSGFNVYTRQVDDTLMEHPDVDVAATIGLPDPKRPGSEIVATAIVLKPGVEPGMETREKITQYMRDKVAPYKVPKRIEFMGELPLSAVGKVLKRELREQMKAD